MQLELTRRRLLAAMAGAGIGATLPLRAENPMDKNGKGARRKDSIGVAPVGGLGGYATHQLAPGLQLAEHCHLTGIVTGSPAKIPVWQEKYGIPDGNVYSYDDFDRIADNPDIQAVYIVTPNDLHKPLTLRAANAGKHVWCEKPMAMDATEAWPWSTHAARTRCSWRSATACSTNPTRAGWWRWRARSPTAGSSRSAPMPASTPMTMSIRRTSRGGCCRSTAAGRCTTWACIRSTPRATPAAKEPVAVTARQKIRRPHLFQGRRRNHALHPRFADGTVAECATSFGENMNTLRADCERGWYELSPFQTYDGLKGRTSDGKTFADEVPHQQARQMDDDALAILRGTPQLVPGEEGVRDMRVVDAIYASARDGGRRIVL